MRNNNLYRRNFFSNLTIWRGEPEYCHNLDHCPGKEKEKDLPIITILLTPRIQNVKCVDANPNEYYFSNLVYEGNNKLREAESKIDTLQVENDDDDALVIEINSYKGNYKTSIIRI